MSEQNTELAVDINFSDEESDDDQVGEEIPKEFRTLRTQTYDKGISDLVGMITAGDLVLDPDYQRNYIWPSKKASLLIESILLNVPIPVVYVAEDQESRWLIVDGLQRLYSLKRFFDNEFKLNGLEILKELNRQQFSTLNPKAKRILRNGILRVVVIKDESHPEIKYDIFQRLNQGAVALNAQELRNCIYRGRFCDLLKKMRQHQPYLDCLGLRAPHPRFYDAELLLRFYALNDAYNAEAGEVEGYPNKMSTFLNVYMNKNRNMSDKRAIQLETLLEVTIHRVQSVFGSPCFRRIRPIDGGSDGELDSRLNRAIMDTILISFARLDSDYVLKNSARILEIYREMQLEDSDFSDALTYGTSDSKKLQVRLNKWWTAVSNL